MEKKDYLVNALERLDDCIESLSAFDSKNDLSSIDKEHLDYVINTLNSMFRNLTFILNGNS